jgi:hypothetical protein
MKRLLLYPQEKGTLADSQRTLIRSLDNSSKDLRFGRLFVLIFALGCGGAGLACR